MAYPRARPSPLAPTPPSALPDLQSSVGEAGLGWGPLHPCSPARRGDTGLFSRCLPFPLSMSSQKLTPSLPSQDCLPLSLQFPWGDVWLQSLEGKLFTCRFMPSQEEKSRTQRSWTSVTLGALLLNSHVFSAHSNKLAVTLAFRLRSSGGPGFSLCYNQEEGSNGGLNGLPCG